MEDINTVMNEQYLSVEEKQHLHLGKLKSDVWPTVKPFVNGGLAGVLTASWISLCCLYRNANQHTTISNLVGGSEDAARARKLLFSNRHYIALKKMIPAALLLQATCGTARIGSFEILTKKVEASRDGMPLSLYQEACCGLTSGAIMACIAAPLYEAGSCLVADASRPASEPLQYRNVVHVLNHKIANEGVSSLWKGLGRHVKGGMAISLGMLPSYNRSFDYFKESVGYSEERTQLAASAVSGFSASVCSLPYWNVCKTMQNMKPDASGKYPYTSSLDCAFKILKSGGPFKFFTGFPLHFCRTAPSIMIFWLALEDVQKFEDFIGV